MEPFKVDADEINRRLGYHKATEETVEMHKDIRGMFIALANNLNDMLPEGREKDLALDTLQVASMYSNASVACNLAPLDLNG